MRQGSAGDCYLIAAINAIVERDPSYVKKMMKDEGDKVAVRFFMPDGAPFTSQWQRVCRVKPAGLRSGTTETALRALLGKNKQKSMFLLTMWGAALLISPYL
ncbi:MAG: hypothetical protein K6A69_02975 [Lachnospiraceae bacterium]|nr:hypothetical protein [Lachnospiraceae bacterium]